MTSYTIKFKRINMKLLSITISSIIITITASAVVVKDWEYKGVTNKNTKAASYSAQTSVNDDSLSIKYFVLDKKYLLWFEFKDKQILKPGRAEFFIRTKAVSGNGRGRYSSDYVFEGKVTVQPNTQGRTQFIVAKLTYNDIQAIKKHSGNNIGVGYFNQDNLWRTYRFSGENLWPSYSRLVQMVKQPVASQRTDKASNNKPEGAMDIIGRDLKSNSSSDEELKKRLNGWTLSEVIGDFIQKYPNGNAADREEHWKWIGENPKKKEQTYDPKFDIFFR